MELKQNICPNCGAKINIETSRFGSMVRCEYCDSEFVVETDAPQEQPIFPQPQGDVHVVRNIPETVIQDTQETAETKMLKYKKKRNITSGLMFVSSMLIGTVNLTEVLFLLMFFLAITIFFVAPPMLAHDKPVEKKDKVITTVKLYGLYFAEFWIGLEYVHINIDKIEKIR